MRKIIALIAALSVAVPALTMSHGVEAQKRKPARAAAVAPDPALVAAVGDQRREADRARDKYRHPTEMLTFFRVRPDMKVGEYAPGGEWFSRLLGLYVGPRGSLVGLYFNPGSGPFNEKAQQGIRDGAVKYPADVSAFTGQPAERFRAMTLDAVPDGEKGTYDRILLLRMLHNMTRWNIADSELKVMRELLKPDGMIGIEQHRARATAPYSYTDGTKGYLREADVVRRMELNGFELVARSEVNANPRDTANWPDGVWTLPPALAKKDVDRDKYLAIGESDRMTLLFRKRP